MDVVIKNKSPEIKCGDFILKLELQEPNERLKEKALKELRETPENIKNGLKELRKLLEAETDLNIPKDNDEWLIKYLRVCKYYPESARDLLRRHYNLREKYPEITQILIPSKFKAVFDANLVSILPQRDQYGRRIVVTLSGKHWDHKVIPQDYVFGASILCSDLLQCEPTTQINGIVYILDMQGLTLGRALQLTLHRTKRCLDYIQGNTPLSVKGFHVVNQPKIFEPIYAAVRPFFNTKYGKRIILHGSNWESLHQYISPECLPERYGGTMKLDLSYGREMYELVSHYEKHYEIIRNYGFKKD